MKTKLGIRMAAAALVLGAAVSTGVDGGVRAVASNTNGPAEVVPTWSESWVDPAHQFGDTNVLVPAFQSLFGERFGFLEIDRSAAEPRLRLGVVGLGVADEVAARRISPAVVLVPAAVSATQLDAWKQAIGAVMVGKQATMVLLPGTEHGTLQLLADNLDQAAISEFRAAVPAGVLEIVVGDPDFRFADYHTTRVELPYEAGLELTMGPLQLPNQVGAATQTQEGGTCTSSYWTTWDAFNYGVTAGHCGRTGTQVHLGRTHLSGVGTNSYYRSNPTNSDASRFFVASERTSWPPRVMTGPGGHRTVRGSFTTPV